MVLILGNEYAYDGYTKITTEIEDYGVDNVKNLIIRNAFINGLPAMKNLECLTIENSFHEKDAGVSMDYFINIVGSDSIKHIEIIRSKVNFIGEFNNLIYLKCPVYLLPIAPNLKYLDICDGRHDCISISRYLKLKMLYAREIDVYMMYTESLRYLKLSSEARLISPNKDLSNLVYFNAQYQKADLSKCKKLRYVCRENVDKIQYNRKLKHYYVDNITNDERDYFAYKKSKIGASFNYMYHIPHNTLKVIRLRNCQVYKNYSVCAHTMVLDSCKYIDDSIKYSIKYLYLYRRCKFKNKKMIFPNLKRVYIDETDHELPKLPKGVDICEIGEVNDPIG